MSQRLQPAPKPGADLRPARILRTLAASRAGMSTPALAAALGETAGTRQQVLTLYGQILRARLRAGQVIRTGRTPGARREGPAVIWEITPSGREALAAYDRQAAGHQARIAARAAATEARRARVQALAQAAVTVAADQGAVTAADRARHAAALRALGCSLRAIGDIFGVSHECIRLDLLATKGKTS